MTPKEKAEELIEKYKTKVSGHSAIKKCALIAVDEILDSCPMYYTGFEYESNLEYWQEVITEIKKL